AATVACFQTQNKKAVPTRCTTSPMASASRTASYCARFATAEREKQTPGQPKFAPSGTPTRGVARYVTQTWDDEARVKKLAVAGCEAADAQSSCGSCLDLMRATATSAEDDSSETGRIPRLGETGHLFFSTAAPAHPKITTGNLTQLCATLINGKGRE